MVEFLNHLVAFPSGKYFFMFCFSFGKGCLNMPISFTAFQNLFLEAINRTTTKKIKYCFIYMSYIFQVLPATDQWFVELLSKMSASPNIS